MASNTALTAGFGHVVGVQRRQCAGQHGCARRLQQAVDIAQQLITELALGAGFAVGVRVGAAIRM